MDKPSAELINQLWTPINLRAVLVFMPAAAARDPRTPRFPKRPMDRAHSLARFDRLTDLLPPLRMTAKSYRLAARSKRTTVVTHRPRGRRSRRVDHACTAQHSTSIQYIHVLPTKDANSQVTEILPTNQINTSAGIINCSLFFCGE